MRTKKSIAFLILTVIIISCCAIAVSACNPIGSINETRVNLLADSFSTLLLGNDAFAWNVFSITPEESYGYVKTADYTWNSYSTATQSDMTDLLEVFELFDDELSNINPAKLSKNAYTKYLALDYVISSYVKYYSSRYALDFTLIGGSYINSEGGYVADFATTVDNYAFRNENDIKNLLEITNSTKDAFLTYLDYAADRIDAGYPLYDYSLSGMKGYLDSVSEQGENYYLYSLVAKKINAVDFIGAEAKQSYIRSYRSSLTNSFMTGVRQLSDGLDQYMGHVVQTDDGYLNAYGEVGRQYYKWQFENKTGIKNVNLDYAYNELVDMYDNYANKLDSITERISILQSSSPDIYADVQAYLSGEKALLGLTTPEQMLDYLKVAAKDIVPDLNAQPQIYFREMDDTVGKVTSTLAYYLHSPLDDLNSPEYITLNSYYIDEHPEELLLATIAHEGYPGHLYAYVQAKENGASLMTEAFSPVAFAEGWAVYVETVLLSNIAAASSDHAVKIYCEYYMETIIANFTLNAIMDMQINYFGIGVDELVSNGMPTEQARNIVEALMENPALYIPYGYGSCVMLTLHDEAKAALGRNYNEVEFNGYLLSEGTATLTRAKELTDEYVASKR